MNINIILPEHLAQIVMMVECGTITRQTGREVMEFFFALGVLKREIGTILVVKP